MCMHDVRKWKRGERKPKYGWKVFAMFGPQIHTCYGKEDPPCEKGRWYEAESHPAQKSGVTYRPGFHVFFTEKDAKWYGDYIQPGLDPCIFRVAVKGHLLLGDTVLVAWSCGPLPTFTAKYMKIVDDVDAPSVWQRIRNVFHKIFRKVRK